MNGLSMMIIVLLVLRSMVVVVEMFAVSLMSIAPFHLSLESVIFLAEIFLSEVLGIVSTSVSPFEHLLSGHIDVLEVLILGITIGSMMRDVQGLILRIGISHNHGQNGHSKHDQLKWENKWT